MISLLSCPFTGYLLCPLIQPANKAKYQHANVMPTVNNMPIQRVKKLPVVKPAMRILTALACLCVIPSLQAQTNVDTEARLSQAKIFEASADYTNAAAAYRSYLMIPGPKSAERRHARLKLPVLQEAVTHGPDPALELYLNAMNLRAEGNIAEADATLVEIVESYAGGALSDDALYLRAYIALMDHYDYQSAIDLLQTLRYNYPDSRYIDTALFAEAISHEQLGDSGQAIAKMTELKDRHVGMSVGGISWARDDFTSRLWFERSKKRIEP